MRHPQFLTALLLGSLGLYRGYGRSDGQPTVKGILEDARAARKELRSLAGSDDSQTVLMGESLGGAVVIQLAE